MAEGKGKYGGLLSEIRQEQTDEAPGRVASLAAGKRPVCTGKRSGPDYIQKGVFLKKETIANASTKRAARGDRTGLPI